MATKKDKSNGGGAGDGHCQEGAASVATQNQTPGARQIVSPEDIERLVAERTAELSEENERLRRELAKASPSSEERFRQVGEDGDACGCFPGIAEDAERKQLAIRNRIANVFLTVPEEDMYSKVLDVVLGELQSKFGFFGYIDEAGNLVCPSMTKDIWDECEIVDKDVVFPRENWGGLWGRSLLEMKALYSNEQLHVPEGHIRLSNSLVVPIIHKDSVIGQIAVANKNSEYGEEDKKRLMAIADYVAPVLRARLRTERLVRDRKWAEKELQLEHTRMMSILEAIPDGVYIVSQQCDIEYINPVIEREFGPVDGRKCHEYFHGLKEVCPWCKNDEVFAGKSVQWEWYSTKNDRHYDLFDMPFRNPDGSVSKFEIFHDITQSKQAEKEREELLSSLGAQNAELERFSYTVSHDLKSPLITINGYVGMLRQDLAEGDSEQVENDLSRISNAADKMDELLVDLLELSRIGRLVNPPEDVSLEEVAHEASKLVSGQIVEKRVQVEISSDLPMVFGDRVRLREVLQNLIENSVKCMGDQSEPRIEIGSRRDGSETICYIRDNGIGVDPRYHEKIFGLFDQLNPKAEGSGIGLSLVKRIVEVHGGRIWVESEGSGHGSTFCFTIAAR